MWSHRYIIAVLGSLELLGNPTVLVNSMALGIYDFFALPTNGAKEGRIALKGPLTNTP